jgi:drug/metabolite transporter superfamily protein YnfA
MGIPAEYFGIVLLFSLCLGFFTDYFLFPPYDFEGALICSAVWWGLFSLLFP